MMIHHHPKSVDMVNPYVTLMLVVGPGLGALGVVERVYGVVGLQRVACFIDHVC